MLTWAVPACDGSLFLESPAETRKTAEALAAKPDPKRAREDEKSAPLWNYGLTTDAEDLSDLPAFAALAQMRLHLSPRGAAGREMMMEQMLERGGAGEEEEEAEREGS